MEDNLLKILINSLRNFQGNIATSFKTSLHYYRKPAMKQRANNNEKQMIAKENSIEEMKNVMNTAEDYVNN